MLGIALAAILAASSPAEPARSNTESLSLPPHPRLLVDAEELGAVKRRIVTCQWARAQYARVKANADSWLTREVALPDRGSQWWHYYACPKHGVRLRTESPTRHVCPVDGEVFTGYPYDDVVLANVHSTLAEGARDCGLAYAVDGDARYAARARDILLAYAAKYQSYPLHDINGRPNVGGGKVGPQTLDEAVWLLPMAEAADLVWSALAADDRAKLADGLFRPAVKVIEDHKMGIHNIQCWKNSAVGVVGLLLGDAGMIDRALNGPSGFHNQIAKGVTDDGPWFEGAWGYHFYTLNALVHLTECARHCGINLYSPRLKLMFDAPLHMAMPDLNLPAFHDSGTVSLVASAPLYEIAYARYRDPHYRALLDASNRQSLYALLYGEPQLGTAPREALASHNFTAAGFAVLRAGSGKDATYLAMDYGPHGGGHGHPDKLSFVLCSRGGVLARDPGTAAYGVPIQAGWYRTSIAHNTLTVDEASQKPAEGKCQAFAVLPGLSAVCADAGPIYDDISFRRTAVLVGADLVLFADQIRSPVEHTYDVALDASSGPLPNAKPLGAWQPPDKPGYSYLRDCQEVKLEPRTGLRFGQGEHEAVLTLADPESTQVILGTAPGASTAERVPAIILRRRGRNTTYLWALVLGSGQAPAEVRSLDVDGAAAKDGAAAMWARRAAQDAVVLITDGNGVVEAGGVASDGRLTCLLTDGVDALSPHAERNEAGPPKRSLYLVGGTYASVDGIRLTLDKTSTVAIGMQGGRPVWVAGGDEPVRASLEWTPDGVGAPRKLTVSLQPGERKALS